MTRRPRILSLAWLFAAIPAHAAGLPDTGLDTCYNNTIADTVPAASVDSISRETGTHPREDCRYGQDAVAAAGAIKTSAGSKGFDYASRRGEFFGAFDANSPLSATLDIDGNGTADALTDGLLVARYLLGVRGPALIQGVVGAGAQRTTVADIEAYIGLFAAIAGYGAGLPDTGQDTCYNDTVADAVPATDPASIARDTGTHPRQDCRYGQDAAAAFGALVKTGAGAKGFDYTKIANNGTLLDAGATLGAAAGDWGCTTDNVTGLTWEVKTATGTDLRYSGHTYSWFNTDPTANGGSAGGMGGNTCNATLPSNQCNTQAFITAVNSAGLCTYTDWRLPTRRELLTLVDADGSSPSIAPTYFPNTNALDYWSGSSYVPDNTAAWAVGFAVGLAEANGKGGTTPADTFYVRLVRGGPF